MLQTLCEIQMSMPEFVVVSIPICRKDLPEGGHGPFLWVDQLGGASCLEFHRSAYPWAHLVLRWATLSVKTPAFLELRSQGPGVPGLETVGPLLLCGRTLLVHLHPR